MTEKVRSPSPPSSAEAMLEEATPPSPSGEPSATPTGKRPWWKHPAFIAACALALVAVIVIPTAVVLTNKNQGSGSSSAAGSGSANPASILDLKMVCVLQNKSEIDISYREAGFTLETLSNIITNSTLTEYPKDVKAIGTVRLLNYPPPTVGPFAGPPACVPQPYLPCLLTADPMDLLANHELVKTAATSAPLAPALTTLWVDSEQLISNGVIYTVTNKTVFPPIQDPRDPHAFFHPAPYYFPDPTCKDANGNPSKIACPFVHCLNSTVTQFWRNDTDMFVFTHFIDWVSKLALRAYYAGAEYTTAGPNATADIFAAHNASLPFKVVKSGSTFTVQAGDLLADQARVVARVQQLLSAFFLSPKTYMEPHFNFAGYAHGYSAKGSFFGDFSFFPQLIDAIALLESLPTWNMTAGGTEGQNGVEISQGLRKWFADLYHWHIKNKPSIKDQIRVNNIGQWNDAVYVSVATYAGNATGATILLNAVPARRIIVSINTEGEMIGETTRASSFSYSAFSLNAMTTLALQADRYAGFASPNASSTKGLGGVWTWYDSKPKRNSSSLQRAVDFIIPYVPGLETFPGSNISALTGKKFEVVNRVWPFPNQRDLDVSGINFIRRTYWNLGGREGEKRDDEGTNTRRYRIAWEEGFGMKFEDWTDMRRLLEPA